MIERDIHTSDTLSNSCAFACEQTGNQGYIIGVTIFCEKNDRDGVKSVNGGSVVNPPTWLVDQFDLG